LERRTIFNIAASGESRDLEALEDTLTKIKDDEGIDAAAIYYAGGKGLRIKIDADTSSYNSWKRELHLTRGIRYEPGILASMIHSAIRSL